MVKVSVSVGGQVSQSAGFPMEGCHCKFGCLLKIYICFQRFYFVFNNPRKRQAVPPPSAAACRRLFAGNCTEMQRETATDVLDEFGAGRAFVFVFVSETL